MSRLRGNLTIPVIVCVCCAMVTLSAQKGDVVLSADHSRAILRQLDAIDADRAGFVNQLMSQWSGYIDYSDYDLYGEIAPLAMKVPAWQLYGASLVGDFHTMLRILTGIEGAGRYINALSVPEPKARPTRATDIRVLGDGTNQLVYTPIAPCRIVDTRNPGAASGILVPGVPRSFHLEDDGLIGQGGDTVCAGLPNFSHLGWAVNVTVVAPTDVGFLRIWPYLGTQPTASVINFWNTSPNSLANAMNVTGCYACGGGDIYVQTFGPSVHVVIDVVGYYQEADPPASTSAVTRMPGTAASIPTNYAQYVNAGDCPAGTTMIGGELEHNGIGTAIGESKQNTATQWTFWVINWDSTATTATAYSRCQDTPIKPW